MGFNTHTTTFLNSPVEKLFTDLVLGSPTLDKGVAQMLQGFRKEVSLSRFYTTGDNIVPVPANGKYTVANNSFNKDEKIIDMKPFAWYNEYNVRDFNIDQKFLWTKGADGMLEPSATLLDAIRPTVIENFNNSFEKMLWQGDLAGATGTSLDIIDGYEKLLLADPTVIAVAPVAITAANVISEFEKYIQAAANGNMAILEKGNPSFVVPNLILAKYREAARALPNKGTDITAEIANVYGGYPIIGVEGMSADTILFGNVGGGDTANLKVATWSDSDRFNVETARLNPLDEVFGVKINVEAGVNYIYGSEFVYSKV